MGSPLGPTFANYYMSEIETSVLSNPDVSPNIYCRYVDDIFCSCTEEHILKLKRELEEISVLTFTYERAVNCKLSFLDILVDNTSDRYIMSVYSKSTDAGKCLNYLSECPERYKISVIKSFIRRAWNTSSTVQLFHIEIQRVKQMLVNNGYPNKLIDSTLSKFLGKVNRGNESTSDKNNISYEIFYENQMNNGYKIDEAVMKKIIKDNVKVVDQSKTLKLVIFYKSPKTRQLVMKNNLSPKKRTLDQNNIIYEYSCKIGECEHQLSHINCYVGHTQCSLSRRLSYHLQNGAIKLHHLITHKKHITRKEIEQRTRIRYTYYDTIKLMTLESLLIYFEKPGINRQDTGKSRTLHLFM